MDQPAQGNNEQANEGINVQGQVKKKKQYYGKVFVGIIITVISIEYYCYVFEIMLGSLNSNNKLTIFSLIFVFNFFLIMILWSFYTTMDTRPGEIPLYWGFYIGDDDYKRKRYCLICNAFKPERCHHCSVCNVCILNMDHHCPWVDNCIGFYNRKFFMILLFYVSCTLIFYDFSAFYFVFLYIEDFFNLGTEYTHKGRTVFVVIGYLFILILSFLLLPFYKFHLTLVLNNSTTIESLEKEHAAENLKYRLTYSENWRQVFGFNKLLWFFPLVLESGRPDGDGLNWRTVPIMGEPNNEPPQQAEMENYNSDQPLGPRN